MGLDSVGRRNPAPSCLGFRAVLPCRERLVSTGHPAQAEGCALSAPVTGGEGPLPRLRTRKLVRAPCILAASPGWVVLVSED